MSPNAIMEVLLAAVPAAALGAAGGWVYFRLLRLTIDSFVAGGGWRRGLVLTLARLGGVGALFWFAAQFGAVPLLAAFAGFLLARHVAVAASKRAA